MPDPEDLGTLGQMLALGNEYIDEQDEPGDLPNVAKMEQVMQQIAALVPGEASEAEPAGESEDE
jgi:hypothetical protein